MSKIPSSARTLRVGASSLLANADALGDSNGSRLLRFYSVECAMKSRYLSAQLAKPHGDTSMIPPGTFGSSEHDLDAGRKALRAPATVPAAPRLHLKDGQGVDIRDAHQVWRYHIPHDGAADVEAWLNTVTKWLKESE